ncbi:MAG: hypothetical protein CM15mP115_05970 [Alphaproteobacteria bacterium]|nr:MAG: hypothetical protein CM15mP115_05970 [Alphaproteobacteria bacterium]
MSDPYDHTAMLEPQDWSFPVPIAYGPGRLAKSACNARGLHSRAAGGDGQRQRGIAICLGPDVDSRRRRHESGLFSDISPNPRDTEIAAGRAAFLSGGMMPSSPSGAAVPWMAARRSA